jgi:hypothetical protein
VLRVHKVSFLTEHDLLWHILHHSPLIPYTTAGIIGATVFPCRNIRFRLFHPSLTKAHDSRVMSGNMMHRRRSTDSSGTAGAGSMGRVGARLFGQEREAAEVAGQEGRHTVVLFWRPAEQRQSLRDIARGQNLVLTRILITSFYI